MKKDKIVMGIDPGTQKMGVAITDGKRIMLRALLKSRGRKLSDRIESLSDQLEEVFRHYAASIDVVLIESAFVGKFKGVSEKLGRMQGVIIEKCIQHKVGYELVAPRKVKSCLLHGNAKKEDIKVKVKEIYGIKEDLPDDVSDAIAISHSYFCI